MKFQIRHVASIVLFLSTLASIAQSPRCATMLLHEKRIHEYPEMENLKQQGEISLQRWLSEHSKGGADHSPIMTIPVVVHILWHQPMENVSDQQVYSQLDVLNSDFRLRNADSLPMQHPFYKFTGDAGIEFCLANRDPLGNPTTGITRTFTPVASWDENALDHIKSTAKGGLDNWAPEKYLNLYVVNLEGETLGFSSFPDELGMLPGLDGVVIRYEAFGTVGTAGGKNFETNNKGRTATHEVGHWLNLFHIWGDERCGDDKVSDTAPAEGENKFCPAFPQRPNNACGSDTNGEMYMNFMDYVEDSCMAMFTKGQAGRMLAAINVFRPLLLNSNGCTITGIGDVYPPVVRVTVSPNPNNGRFVCKLGFLPDSRCTVNLFNSMGVLAKKFNTRGEEEINVDCSELHSGIYYLVLTANSKTYIEKVVVTR